MLFFLISIFYQNRLKSFKILLETVFVQCHSHIARKEKNRIQSRRFTTVEEFLVLSLNKDEPRNPMKYNALHTRRLGGPRITEATTLGRSRLLAI